MKRMLFCFLIGVGTGAGGLWYLQQGSNRPNFDQARHAVVSEADKARSGLKEKIGEMTVSFGSVTEDVRTAATRLVRPFNVLGWPALALPCGLAEAGLPASVQLVAPPDEDAFVLAAGAALERALT